MLAAVVEEVHGGYVRLKVSKDVDLAAAFSALEDNKAALQILDYNISQCTLEQVFLKFAKDQEEETGQVGGLNVTGAAEDDHKQGHTSAPRPVASPAAAEVDGHRTDGDRLAMAGLECAVEFHAPRAPFFRQPEPPRDFVTAGDAPSSS